MSVRGKKRAEVIQKWLDGEDDPEFEVKPTKNEGKYIVKRRMLENVQTVTTDDNELDNGSDISNESKIAESRETKVREGLVRVKDNNTEMKDKDTKVKVVKTETKDEKSKVKNNKNSVISSEILKELRLMGEENRRIREKKEKKKEIKHAVQKQLSKKPKVQPKEQSSDYEYYEDEEPQPMPQPIVQYEPQLKIRRRINLLDKRY